MAQADWSAERPMMPTPIGAIMRWCEEFMGGSILKTNLEKLVDVEVDSLVNYRGSREHVRSVEFINRYPNPSHRGVKESEVPPLTNFPAIVHMLHRAHGS